MIRVREGGDRRRRRRGRKGKGNLMVELVDARLGGRFWDGISDMLSFKTM